MGGASNSLRGQRAGGGGAGVRATQLVVTCAAYRLQHARDIFAVPPLDSCFGEELRPSTQFSFGDLSRIGCRRASTLQEGVGLLENCGESPCGASCCCVWIRLDMKT